MGNANTTKSLKYEKGNVTRKVIKFYPNDAELLDYLNTKDNVGGYIKELIRRDMQNGVVQP